MSKRVYEPKALTILEVVCDRCGKAVKVEIENDVTAIPQGIPLPDGWVEVGHPNGVDDALTFDQRACTSTWFKAWVRRLYNAPEPGPRRRRKGVPVTAEPGSLADRVLASTDGEYTEV